MQTTIELAEFRIFSAVVEEGSFTAAADRLATDKARVSRMITRLEQKLSARLLERSTRRVNLTEVGRDVYERGKSILRAVEATEAAVARRMAEPTGRLRLTCGPEFAKLSVDDWVAAYLAKYPKVTVEAEYTRRVVDLIYEGVDLAIRIGPLTDSELSARRLGALKYGVYASREYVARTPPPKTPGDLSLHDIVDFNANRATAWTLVSGATSVEVAVKPRLRVNDTLSAAKMVAQGLGVGVLPEIAAANHGSALVRLLSDWSRIPAPVHAVFPSTRYMDPKVRAFIDLAKRMFR
ncbi:MAG: LysR family transcriptional regulator [Pseudomonadota bacterium]